MADPTQAFRKLQDQSKRAFSGFFQALGEAGIEHKVVSHWRDYNKQESLYAKGRSTKGKVVTTVRGGGSYHNWGLAYDLHIPKGNYEAAAKIAEKFGIEWGGNWDFYDPAHFHYSGGKGVNQRKAGGWKRKWTPQKLIELFKKGGFTLAQAIKLAKPGAKPGEVPPREIRTPQQKKGRKPGPVEMVISKWHDLLTEPTELDVPPPPDLLATAESDLEEVAIYSPAQRGAWRLLQAIDPDLVKDLFGGVS